MTKTIPTEYVEKNYQPNLAEEDFLPDGRNLRKGMVVLVGNPALRTDLAEAMLYEAEWRPKILQRHTKLSVGAEKTWRANDPTYENSPEMKIVREALRKNRWCKIASIEHHEYEKNTPDHISVHGIYADNSEFWIYVNVEEPWFVKKEEGADV